MQAKAKFEKINRPLTADEDRLLTESIEQDGVLDPIILYNNTDYVVDGYNRVRIAKKLGIPESDIPTREVYFESEDEAEEWCIRKQLARRNLNPKDFKVFVGTLYNRAKKSSGRPAIKCAQNGRASAH